MCFIVAEEKARAILSRETSEELAILKLEINAMKEETLLRDFPGCFKGVGTLKVVHTGQIRPKRAHFNKPNESCLNS